MRGDRNAKTLFDRIKGVDIWLPNAFDMYLRRHRLSGKIKKNTPEWNKEFERYKEWMKL